MTISKDVIITCVFLLAITLIAHAALDATQKTEHELALFTSEFANYQSCLREATFATGNYSEKRMCIYDT
ncbi:MAG: hypothetical protein V1722_04465 [Candidatus Micrarchaeota archaeon]